MPHAVTAPIPSSPGTLPAVHAGRPAAGPSAPATLRTDPRTRRDVILEAAAELFSQYGYHGASLRDIARQANISHPGMLHHFPSKSALLSSVIDGLEDRAQQALDSIEDLCSDPDTLLESVSTLYDPAARPIQLLAMLDADAVSADYPGRFRIARLRRVHEHILQRCFEHCADAGHLRADVDPEFAARSLLSLVMGHAFREETVRTMQRDLHGDEPTDDLRGLLRLFLR